MSKIWHNYDLYIAKTVRIITLVMAIIMSLIGFVLLWYNWRTGGSTGKYANGIISIITSAAFYLYWRFGKGDVEYIKGKLDKGKDNGQ